MSVQDDVARLAKESAAAASEAERLRRLHAAFPDLQKRVGRWNKVAYFSKSVNGRVNMFDMRHNCGCCNNSPLEVWPYLETPDGNVYSDPPEFRVGERHWMGGDRPRGGWREEMEAAEISPAIVGTVAEHFRESREDRVRSASEEGGDDE